MQNQSIYTAYEVEYFPLYLSPEHAMDPNVVMQSPQPGNIESLHYHNAFELGYCFSGSGLFIVDGEAVPFHAPCAVMIYENQLHKAQSHALDPSKWVFLSADIPMLLADIQTSNVLEAMDFPTSFHAAGCVITPENDAILTELIHSIITEMEQKRAGYLGVIKGMMWAALLRHRRLLQSDGNEDDANRKRRLLKDIGPAISYISSNFTQPIRMSRLTTLCCTSEATLRRKFEELLNSSPLDYLHKLRIVTAAALLLNSSLTILEIGYQVGYNTPSSFNRQFQRIYNTSPTAWRKKKYNE